jgi:hypothetical protein
MGKEPRSEKSVLALFSQEQLRALLILDLELGALPLDAALAPHDHLI